MKPKNRLQRRFRGVFKPAEGVRSNRKRRAAAAGGGGVRVLDDELGAFEAILVVDLGAHQILQAHGVDQQGDAVFYHLRVVFVHRFVEREAVLKAGATAALHEHAQLQVIVAFLVDQLLDLGRRAVGEQQGGGRGGHFGGGGGIKHGAHGVLL